MICSFKGKSKDRSLRQLLQGNSGVRVMWRGIKKPRDRMIRGAKNLVGCGQPKELFNNRLLAGDSLRLPAAAKGLVDRDNAAIQVNFGLGLTVFGVQTFTLSVEQH